MKKIFAILLAIHCCVYADDIILPDEKVDVVIENDYKNLQWNRYVVDKFTILSINDKQGRWFYNNIKDIKNWCLNRWGISNYEIKQECRIMVVPDKKMLKRFFNLDQNHIEFREKNGKVEIVAVWLCLEEGNKEQVLNDIPRIISHICFKDMMLNKNLNKKFLEVGISLLNQSNNEIKNSLLKIDQFDLSFLNIDQKAYDNLGEAEQKEYDNKSLLLCLMLKKEFGEFNFLKFLFDDEKKILDSINKIYGFKNDEFIHSSKRYFMDIKNCLQNDKINNRYLNIERSK